MDEQHWQALMKRMDFADKIADALLYDEEEEEDGDANEADNQMGRRGKDVSPIK